MPHRWKYETWTDGPLGFGYAITDSAGDVIALVRGKENAVLISHMKQLLPLIEQQSEKLLSEARALHGQIEKLTKGA